MDEPSSSPSTTLFTLGALGTLHYKSYTHDVLKIRPEVADSLPDNTEDIWRNRIICCLAIEGIFCINFIPLDCSKMQTIQVMRLNNEEEDASSYSVYCHDYLPYKFILPREYADIFFDLSKLQISQTVEQLTPNLIPIVKKAIGYLSKDPALRGLALTLNDKDGTQKTYIWLKGRPTSHVEDSSQLVRSCQPQ
jgi:hypothetical protein